MLLALGQQTTLYAAFTCAEKCNLHVKKIPPLQKLLAPAIRLNEGWCPVLNVNTPKCDKAQTNGCSDLRVALPLITGMEKLHELCCC